MNLADTNRYEDQFYQFDTARYENMYRSYRVPHPITDNAEPDYGNDLVNIKLNKDFDNENIKEKECIQNSADCDEADTDSNNENLKLNGNKP